MRPLRKVAALRHRRYSASQARRSAQNADVKTEPRCGWTSQVAPPLDVSWRWFGTGCGGIPARTLDRLRSLLGQGPGQATCSRARGKLLDHFQASGNVTAGYAILFVFCGTAYLAAFGIGHLLAPRFEPVQIEAMP